MKITNPWVGYLDRSYRSVKLSILNRIKTLVPEITDLSDSNLLVVIVSIFSGMVEHLNYYIDSMAREVYLTTARKLSSVLKIVKIMNYRVRASMAASVDITFTIPVAIAEGTTFTIPQGTRLETVDGVKFITTKSRTFLGNTKSLIVPAKQRVLVSLYSIGVTTGAAGLTFALPNSYEDSTLVIEIDSVTWELQNDLGLSISTDKHFYVAIDETGAISLKFGDGIKGLIPPTGKTVWASYYTTDGSKGNLVGPETITTLLSTIVLPTQVPTIDSMTVSNPDYPSGGTNTEGIEDIRKFAPLYLRTLDRAVTRQDYKDIAKLAPGVDKSDIEFNCGKKIILYIAPLGGGIAANTLLDSTDTFMASRKIEGTILGIKAAGETYIKLDIEATARFRVNPSIVETDIKEALVQAYSGDNSDINKPIRLSDIIALIDNLERVDFLTIHQISAVPYARPFNHEKQLPWTRYAMAGSTSILNWKILYTGGVYKLYLDSQFVQDITLNVPVVYQDILTFMVTSIPAGLVNGNYWTFNTYPFNQDIILSDYTVPRVHPFLQYINIVVNPQSFII